MDMDNDDLLFLEWEDDSSLLFDDFEEVASSFQPSNNTQSLNQVSTKGEKFFQQIDEDLDYAFALSLQTQYNDEVKENTSFNLEKSCTKTSQSSKPLSIIDEQWELIDPHPDIHALFLEYDEKFFYGKLKHVEVKWSPRMTSCAGVCSYEGRGGLCSVRLSEPLLKLRPRKDLVETLLHEMIHAYLFVTHNNKDRDGHGPQFLSHMNRINKETGTKITVYHSFHDEVDLYRQHWWKCNGPCKNKRPYYGLLKRAMNRAPGPSDNWWADHQASCGGTFIKIKEPESYAQKKTTKRKATSDPKPKCKGSSSDIRNFINDGVLQTDKSSSIASSAKSNTSHVESSVVHKNSTATLNNKNTSPKKQFVPFQGTGHKLGGSSDGFNWTFPVKESSLSKVPPSSLEKAVNIRPVNKVPRLSKSQTSVFEGKKPSTSNNVARNLVQSPIEKFLSSKVTDKSKSVKDNFVNKIGAQESDVLKVSCPVCFILVRDQDINSHLDVCLSS